jgi:hypothetical protein
MVGTILAEADSATEDKEFGKGNSAVKIDLSLRQARPPRRPLDSTVKPSMLEDGPIGD